MFCFVFSIKLYVSAVKGNYSTFAGKIRNLSNAFTELQAIQHQRYTVYSADVALFKNTTQMRRREHNDNPLTQRHVTAGTDSLKNL